MTGQTQPGSVERYDSCIIGRWKDKEYWNDAAGEKKNGRRSTEKENGRARYADPKTVRPVAIDLRFRSSQRVYHDEPIERPQRERGRPVETGCRVAPQRELEPVSMLPRQ